LPGIAARVERAYKLKGGGGVTEEVFEVVGAGLLGETGGIFDDLRQRLLIKRKKLRKARSCPCAKIGHVVQRRRDEVSG
jgi:hypothetical protein